MVISAFFFFSTDYSENTFFEHRWQINGSPGFISAWWTANNFLCVLTTKQNTNQFWWAVCKSVLRVLLLLRDVEPFQGQPAALSASASFRAAMARSQTPILIERDGATGGGAGSFPQSASSKGSTYRRLCGGTGRPLYHTSKQLEWLIGYLSCRHPWYAQYTSPAIVYRATFWVSKHKNFNSNNSPDVPALKPLCGREAACG